LSSDRQREPAQRLCLRRTRASLVGEPAPLTGRYGSAEEIDTELLEIQDALIADGLERSAWGEVAELRWQVATFGFHLASLEIRQHASVHAAALAAIRSGAPGTTEVSVGVTLDEVLATFRAIGEAQARFGPDACHRYVVSFTSAASDMADVLELARLSVAGDEGARGGEPPDLDVVPLFESSEALNAAGSILAELLDDPVYRARIAARGDRQEVITKDNVVVTVNATIFTQIVDAKAALFSVANFDIGIDALARTALRSVIGTMTLDQALSERERINVDVQQQMEVVTDKWGIRISRIEIVEIAPPPQILLALALEKQADQEKRAKILQSQGLQQSAVNVAQGNADAAVHAAEGEKQAAILRAEGNRQAAILEADGRAQAIATVYGAITAADPNPALVAILQLDTLAKFAESDNTTTLVPYESAGLLGAAQALRSVLDASPSQRG